MDDLSEIIEAIKPAIIVIKLPDGKYGSGFFVNNKGLLITNKHTVGLNTFFKITLFNSSEVDATVVFSDNDIDFSFAIANVQSSTPISLADSNLVKDGEQVFAIGHPYGYNFTISKGIISCKDRVVKGRKYIQTDVPTNPGNSGGPLVNSKGEAVGINSWVIGSAENMSFAVPTNSIKDILDILSSKFDRLLSMYYCPICGFLSDEFIKTSKAEYCKNCGAQKMEKKKGKETKHSIPQAQAVNVATRICPKCKTANDSASNFCKNCGLKFK
jgi:serine protease Do